MNPDLEQLIRSQLEALPKASNGSGDEYESHRALCRQLGQINRATPWVIGSLLDERERKWGERYTDAAEDFWLDEKTLRNYCWVFRKAGRSFRKDQPQLSFSHYLHVAALDEDGQREWLDRAVAENWSKEQLRLALRSARGLPGAQVEIPAEDELEETYVERDRLRDALKDAYQQIRDLEAENEALREGQPLALEERDDPLPVTQWREYDEESVKQGRFRWCKCPSCGFEFSCSGCR